MAQNSRERSARGVNGTLMSEAGKETSKGPQISARFKFESGQKGETVVASRWTSEASSLWYATVTNKTRERTIDSLVYAGLRRKVAEQFVEMTGGLQLR